MIWYEWLDEAWAVLILNYLLNLVFELKFLDVFMGREDPIEFNIYYGPFSVCEGSLGCLICFVGVMGGINLTPPFYYYIYLYLLDPFILIVRLNYLRDNSVIFLESSYRQGGLRPRCWIKVYFRCRS